LSAMKRPAALFLLLLSALPLAAQDTIWVALVRAETEGTPGDARILLMQPRLERVFGFPSYRLLGEANVSIREKYAQWILPRKDLYLKMEPLPPTPPMTNLIHFEIYCRDKQIVQGKFQPQPATPLFINGPDCRKGRMIFIMQPLFAPSPTPTP
jgi:hypothetical protein